MSIISQATQIPNTRKAPYSIVPDIHATRNFPVGKQPINDRGETLTAEAFFEVKTYTTHKTRYKHNNETIKPPDRRAGEMRNHTIVQPPKVPFAADVVVRVGSGGWHCGGTRVEQSQNRFRKEQVISVCAGWFGEIN